MKVRLKSNAVRFKRFKLSMEERFNRMGPLKRLSIRICGVIVVSSVLIGGFFCIVVTPMHRNGIVGVWVPKDEEDELYTGGSLGDLDAEVYKFNEDGTYIDSSMLVPLEWRYARGMVQLQDIDGTLSLVNTESKGGIFNGLFGGRFDRQLGGSLIFKRNGKEIEYVKAEDKLRLVVDEEIKASEEEISDLSKVINSKEGVVSLAVSDIEMEAGAIEGENEDVSGASNEIDEIPAKVEDYFDEDGYTSVVLGSDIWKKYNLISQTGSDIVLTMYADHKFSMLSGNIVQNKDDGLASENSDVQVVGGETIKLENAADLQRKREEQDKTRLVNGHEVIGRFKLTDTGMVFRDVEGKLEKYGVSGSYLYGGKLDGSVVYDYKVVNPLESAGYRLDANVSNLSNGVRYRFYIDGVAQAECGSNIINYQYVAKEDGLVLLTLDEELGTVMEPDYMFFEKATGTLYRLVFAVDGWTDYMNEVMATTKEIEGENGAES